LQRIASSSSAEGRKSDERAAPPAEVELFRRQSHGWSGEIRQQTPSCAVRTQGSVEDMALQVRKRWSLSYVFHSSETKDC